MVFLGEVLFSTSRIEVFFLIFSRYFKDHDAKIRTLFLALSAFVRKCPQMSANVRFFSHLLLFMSKKISNFAALNNNHS